VKWRSRLAATAPAAFRDYYILRGITMENNEILLEDEELDNILTLTDENGEDAEFEYLDTIDYEGKEYIVLMPLDEESNEILILEVQPVDEELENYVTVSNEAILDGVYAIFKDRFKDILDFAD
jgi:uncharacterized protein YrzB (UPF0473 family)